MTRSRIVSLHATMVALTIGGCAAAASAADEPPTPRPVAPDIATFAAPADPPTAEDAAPAPAVEPVAPLELRTALELALGSNPELAAFAWRVRGAEARGLPGSKLGRPDLEVRLYSLAEQDGEEDVGRARVIYSQPFELGGKRRRRVDLANAERDVAERDLEMKRAEIASEVRTRFTAVLGAQRRVETLRNWIAFVDRTEKLVSASVAQGTLRALEAHRIRRRVAEEQSDVRSAGADLAAARFRLSALWGNVTPRFTEALGVLEPAAPIPDLDTILALAAEGPATARWEAEQQRAAAAIDLAKANRVTDLSVGVGARWIETQSNPDWLLDFDFELPVFGRGQGDIREAQFDLARVEASIRSDTVNRDTAIAAAYHTLMKIDARRTALTDDVIPASRTLVEVYQSAFESGAATYEELLDVRRDSIDAELDHVDTLVAFHEAVATLEGLVGLDLSGFD